MDKEVGLLLIRNYILGNEVYENRNGILLFLRVKDSPKGKEFDTYKLGTVANSTSTMHKLASTPITLDCFEIDDYNDNLTMIDDQHLGVRISQWIDDLEQLRQRYLQTGDKKYWKELIRWLPEGWTQTRTVTLNYENVYNMIHQRENHKLKEWSEDFINWAKTLSHADDLLFIGDLK